jgi:hypothetical protein
MKAYGGSDVWSHVFLTSTLDGGEWSASRPGHFPPREMTPGTHWIGSWVCPRTGPDDVEKKKILLYGDSNSDPLAVQHVASRYTD